MTQSVDVDIAIVGSGFAGALCALALRQRRSPLSGTCNGVYIRRADLGAPVEEITPLAAHVGHTFTTGPVGSDVSPVAWKVLRERGAAGPDDIVVRILDRLDPEVLRSAAREVCRLRGLREE